MACAVNSWGQTSRCPCVNSGQKCSLDRCKCRNCGNITSNKSKQLKTQCRCGEREKLKSSKVESCTDVQGRNRTKCPCFVNGLGCKNCHCYNCKNIYGEKESSLEKNKDLPTGKRKSGLSSPPSLKRQRGSQFLKENGITNHSGGWSELEGCILDMTESFLYSTSILPSKENIFTLYNYVIQSSAGRNSDVKLNTKSLAQVIGKLDYKKRRLDAILSHLSESQLDDGDSPVA